MKKSLTKSLLLFAVIILLSGCSKGTFSQLITRDSFDSIFMFTLDKTAVVTDEKEMNELYDLLLNAKVNMMTKQEFDEEQKNFEQVDELINCVFSDSKKPSDSETGNFLALGINSNSYILIGSYDNPNYYKIVEDESFLKFKSIVIDKINNESGFPN